MSTLSQLSWVKRKSDIGPSCRLMRPEPDMRLAGFAECVVMECRPRGALLANDGAAPPLDRPHRVFAFLQIVFHQFFKNLRTGRVAARKEVNPPSVGVRT